MRNAISETERCTKHTICTTVIYKLCVSQSTMDGLRNRERIIQDMILARDININRNGRTGMGGRRGKKLLAVCLMFAMLTGLLGGCGGGGEASWTDEQGTAAGDGTGSQTGAGQSDGKTQAGGESAADEPTAMGRYVEETVDLSEKVCYPLNIIELADGRLVILDGMAGQFVSSDGGESWETVPIPESTI